MLNLLSDYTAWPQFRAFQFIKAASLFRGLPVQCVDECLCSINEHTPESGALSIHWYIEKMPFEETQNRKELSDLEAKRWAVLCT